MKQSTSFLAVFFACCVACSGRGGAQGRAVQLVSTEASMDRALAVAHRAALDGDLEHAEALLRAATDALPNDPRATEARLLLARVIVARGDAANGARIALAQSGNDPAIERGRHLALGVAAVRDGRYDQALPHLRPLWLSLPDRADSAEYHCALTEAESNAGLPGKALLALAHFEQLTANGAPWLPSTAGCDSAETRVNLLRSVLGRINDPQLLANALDVLPADSALRRVVAVRLRSLAEAAGQLPRWLSWLGDLPDDRGAENTTGSNQNTPVLSLGVLVPLRGPSSQEGVSVLRGISYALETRSEVRVVPREQGNTIEQALAALEELHAARVNAVVGVTREEFANAIAQRAQALSMQLWLLTPADFPIANARTIAPSAQARATAIAATARELARGHRVITLAPQDHTGFAATLSRACESAGTACPLPSRVGTLPQDPLAVHIALAGAPREDRTRWQRQASRNGNHWIWDARGAIPGTPGHWVGMALGPGFPALLEQHCDRIGEPPDELTLLAFETARRAVEITNQPPVLSGEMQLVHGEARAVGGNTNTAAPANLGEAFCRTSARSSGE